MDCGTAATRWRTTRRVWPVMAVPVASWLARRFQVQRPAGQRYPHNNGRRNIAEWDLTGTSTAEAVQSRASQEATGHRHHRPDAPGRAPTRVAACSHIHRLLLLPIPNSCSLSPHTRQIRQEPRTAMRSCLSEFSHVTHIMASRLQTEIVLTKMLRQDRFTEIPYQTGLAVSDSAVTASPDPIYARSTRHAQNKITRRGRKSAGGTRRRFSSEGIGEPQAVSHGPTASFCVCQRGFANFREASPRRCDTLQVFGCGASMRIQLTSIMVDNQEKALRFYTKSWASRRT